MANFTRLEFETQPDARLYVEMRSCSKYRRELGCDHAECDDLFLYVGYVLVERDGKWFLTF